MRSDELSSPARKCSDSSGNPIRIPLSLETARSEKAKLIFVPRELNLVQGHVYTFQVKVRARASVCYPTNRVAFAKVSVLIAPQPLPELTVTVCSEHPCACETSSNDRQRFNPGSKAVLQGCSTEPVDAHDWSATSPAALAGSAFVSPTGYGISKQPVVTVVMKPPITDNIFEP